MVYLNTLKDNRYVVLLAGGQGSRFWPLSRTIEPKQFLPLYQKKSLFEETIERIKSLVSAKNIFIATSDLYRSQISELVTPYKIPAENIICETESKNTAPSIAVAVRLISLKDPSAKVCILPCDHMIKRKNNFLSLLNLAFNNCRDHLVTLGIPSDRPATGYGYIKISGEKEKGKKLYRVERFLEKPDLKNAIRFFKDKKYFWNAGIFIGSCNKFLQEFKHHAPLIYAQLLKIRRAQDLDLVWKKMPFISFDYAILERSLDILMLEAQDLGWSDLGSWQAWDEILTKDKKGNSFLADVINMGSKNTTVLGKNRLIATIGLEDVIVVDTPDALLITKKDNSEKVKNVVEILKLKKRQEHYYHRTVKRPWGSYTVLDMAGGFKIKLVEVRPKKSLSLQLHRRRSEHWVVVDGKAKIIRNKKCLFVNSNQSTYIPVACVHRLMNPTDKTLKIVEVQTGNYLEEDDIIRLKDDFGRVK